MNILAAVQPLLALAPPALASGTSGALRTAPDLSRIVPDVRGAVAGQAADAMSSQLGEAVRGATTTLGAGPVLDELSQQASRLVDEAIRDITGIAGECLAAIAGHLTTGGLPWGPLAAVHLAGVVPIVEDHRLRAEERLNLLGRDLGSLTRQVEAVELPATPPAPTALTAPNSAESGSGAPAGHVPPDGATPGSLTSSSTVQNASAHIPDTSAPGAPSPQAAAAVAAARSAVGTPYQWGGTTPGVGMDCSGLTHWAYSQAGVDLPRTAESQTVGAPVSADQLAPGDLVVWEGHVAMYVGDGQMVEAGDPVQINPVRTENIGMNFLGYYRPTA